MCVTFSGTVSFFLVPITFIHGETEGQRWVTPSLQKAAYTRPPRILPCLSWFHTPASLGPAHVSYVRELKPLLLNVPFPSDAISQKSRLPSAVSLCRVRSVIRIPQTPHNSLQAGQVAPPTARCKTSAELSSLEKGDFSESQKSR